MRSLFPLKQDWMWLSKLYPELERIPRKRWPQALQRARETELLPSEWIGILAAVGVSAYGLQPFGDPAAGLLVHYLGQFLLALPLVALLASPWLVRRTRRGLRREADRFYGGDPCPESQAPTPRPGSKSGPTVQHRTAARRRTS
jgi:hypothetical protein